MSAHPVQAGPAGSPDGTRAGAEGPHTRPGQLSDTGHRPPSTRPRDEPYGARDTDLTHHGRVRRSHTLDTPGMSVDGRRDEQRSWRVQAWW